MRNIVLALCLGLCAIVSNAQNKSIEIGRMEFRKGNYKDAVGLFNGAIATVSNPGEKTKLTEEKEKASACWETLEKANRYYSQSNYETARDLYRNILSYNSSDSYARAQIEKCRNNIELAERRAADNRFWNNIVLKDENNISLYVEYLNKYPDGVHASEAKMIVDEDRLWAQTISENTEQAFNNYLAISKLKKNRKTAEDKIFLFSDNKLWNTALNKNDKASYQKYLNTSKNASQYVNQAYAKIALFDARDQYSLAQYKEARGSFEKNKKYFLLSPNDLKSYLKCCEETDYIAMRSVPSIWQGEAFISNYPASLYLTEVKDLLSRKYADGQEFSKARLYAQNKDTKKYIKNRERNYKNTSSYKYNSSGRVDWDHFAQLGFGVGADMLGNNYTISIPLELKLGRINQLFNVSIGESFILKDGYGAKENPILSSNQYATNLLLRFNFGSLGNDNIRMFIAAGGSFNVNTNSKFKKVEYTEYTSSTQKMDVKAKDILHKTNYSAMLHFGIGGKVAEFSIYGIYDVTPVYNVDQIDKMFTYEIDKYTTGDKIQERNFYEYDNIKNQVKNKLRIGCSIKFYLFSGYKW